MSVGKILLIDDEDKLRKLLSRIVELEGFEVIDAMNAKAALKKLEQQEVDIVICDVKLPDENGVELTKQIKEKYPLTEIIVLTAYGNIPDGVQAIKNGAFDYLTKGDENNKIIPLIHRAIEKVTLQKRLQQLEKEVGKKYSFESIIGKSKQIRDAINLAEKVAVTDTTVLLLGETGTGKEVFAQAIHNASTRKLKPFVAVNCSAFTKELLESEMFGHVAGAYTGAIKETKGLFEEANAGTIFLDEISEMNIDLQAKLLRVLEIGEFNKVGDSKTKKVNVRIIAASNRDLKREADAGNFRLDLFYRLSVFQIVLPPLRERAKDIDLLAEHFAKIFSSKLNKREIKLSEEYLSRLRAHPWKGNIRELKNVIERSVILEDSEQLTVTSLPPEIQVAMTAYDSGKQLSAFSLASAEKLQIQKVLNYTQGNKTEAARLLGIGVPTLYRKLEEYKLN